MGIQQTIKLAGTIAQGAKKANFVAPACHVKMPTRYAQRQIFAAENLGYGWNENLARYKQFGVTDEMINTFTPHRRLSKKPCTLSDPQYFIQKYEDEVRDELKFFNLKDWELLSEAEKVDLIVKYRYKKLVANKVMNTIGKCKEEHHFLIGENGTIMAHDVGNDESVAACNASKISEFAKLEAFDIPKKQRFRHIDAELAEISIHNHPSTINDLLEIYPQNAQDPIRKTGLFDKPIKWVFSDADIQMYLDEGYNGYVVDSSLNKFYFRPNIIIGGFDKLDEIKKIISSTYNKSEKQMLKKMNGIQRKAKNLNEGKSQNAGADVEKIKEEIFNRIVHFLEQISFSEPALKFINSNFFRNNIGKFEQL